MGTSISKHAEENGSNEPQSNADKAAASPSTSTRRTSLTANPRDNHTNTRKMPLAPPTPTDESISGDPNITRPPPIPRLYDLSELIDPASLPIDSHIRSPSGHFFAPEQFLVHPGRPRSIRERQESIAERIRAASRVGGGGDATRNAGGENAEGEGEGEGEVGWEAEGNGRLKWRWFCSCFGRR